MGILGEKQEHKHRIIKCNNNSNDKIIYFNVIEQVCEVHY